VEQKVDVLIVEDCEESGRLFQLLITSAGLSVRLTSSGVEALELLLDHHLRPALILLDMQLPTLSGVDVVRRLRTDRELAATRVIALTAHAMPGDRERFTSAGCDDYISKPIDTQEFVRRVRQEVEATRASPE
jgi:CheY-like chemotaxis protein